MSINRSIMPPPSGVIDFHLPPMETFTMNDGVPVHYIQKRGMPVIQLNVMLEAGTKFDSPEKSGLANLVAILLDEGAGEYDSMELSDRIEELGSSISVSCHKDYIYFSLLSLTEHFPETLRLLSLIMKSPQFNEADFQREKRKILTRLLQLEDIAEETANRAFDEKVYLRENPYGLYTPGNRASIERITHQDVIGYYDTHCSRKRMSITGAGNAPVEALKDALNTFLSGVSRTDETVALECPSGTGPAQIYLLDKKDAVQTEIRAGHVTVPRQQGNYLPRQLMNMILGGQFTSRINLNLRETNGFTYGAHSLFQFNKNSGYFMVTTSVNTENTGQALAEILKELNGIRESIEPEELDFARTSLIRKFPSRFETCHQIAHNLNYKVMFDLPDDYFNTYLDKVRAVTMDEVRAAAQEHITPEHAQIVLVGDVEKMKRSLEGIVDLPVSVIELTR